VDDTEKSWDWRRRLKPADDYRPPSICIPAFEQTKTLCANPRPVFG
jgi:hypothetical protein